MLFLIHNALGSKLVTASADGNSRVYNTMTGACHAILSGHEGEISKVAFNPQGSRILTASSDKTARIWETETGDCLQVQLACYLYSYVCHMLHLYVHYAPKFVP